MDKVYVTNIEEALTALKDNKEVAFVEPLGVMYVSFLNRLYNVTLWIGGTEQINMWCLTKETLVSTLERYLRYIK